MWFLFIVKLCKFAMSPCLYDIQSLGRVYYAAVKRYVQIRLINNRPIQGMLISNKNVRYDSCPFQKSKPTTFIELNC